MYEVRIYHPNYGLIARRRFKTLREARRHAALFKLTEVEKLS